MRVATDQIRSFAVVLLLLLSGYAVIQSWSFGQAFAGMDYYQFWVVGEAVEHDAVHNPYTDEERARIGALFLARATHDSDAKRQSTVAKGRPVLETYSTPFLYTAIHWFASGDYETDYGRWHAISLWSFVAGVVGIARHLGISWLATLVILNALLLRFAPFQSETQVMNVNSVQLGLLALVLVLQRNGDNARSPFLAGAVLGCATMFKPNIALISVLLLASLLITRQFRTLLHQGLGIATGVVFAFASSSLFFGTVDCWLGWFQTIAWIPPEIITPQMGNYASFPFVAGAAAANYSTASAFALCVPAGIAIWRRRDDPIAPRAGESQNAAQAVRIVTLYGIGCSAFLLSANLVWEHYFILTIPLLLATLAAGIEQAPETPGQWMVERILPALALLGLMATPTLSLAELPHEIYFPVVQGGGTLILYGLGLRLLSLDYRSIKTKQDAK